MESVVYKRVSRAKLVDTTCYSCLDLVKRRLSGLDKWSGLCKRCSNLIKLEKARTVPNPADGKPYEALYNNLVYKASKRGVSANITYLEFLEFTRIKECHYCNTVIKWSIRNLLKNGSKSNLDRKDNLIGYSKENCVVCCWKCNNSKGNRYSYEEWYTMNRCFREKDQNEV